MTLWWNVVFFYFTPTADSVTLYMTTHSIFQYHFYKEWLATLWGGCIRKWFTFNLVITVEVLQALCMTVTTWSTFGKHENIQFWKILLAQAERAYSWLPITRTFKGNRKRFELSGVRVIGSSKKIAESKVKNRFYCTVNILITSNCRNVKWKLKDTPRLWIRT